VYEPRANDWVVDALELEASVKRSTRVRRRRRRDRDRDRAERTE